VTGWWSRDEELWYPLGHCTFPWVSGNFRVGVNACNGNYQGGSAPEIPVRFNYLRMDSAQVHEDPCGAVPLPFEEPFDSPSLDPCWSWVREAPSHWSLSTRPGWMTIVSQAGTMYESSDAHNLLLRARPQGNFIFQTRMAIQPTHAYQGGGLMLYANDGQFVRLIRQRHSYEDKLVFQGHIDSDVNFLIANTETLLSLRMTVIGNHVTGAWSTDEIVWHDFGNCTLPWLAGDFSIGVNACNGNYQGGAAPEIPVSFDYFRMDNLGPISEVCGEVSGIWTRALSPYLVTCDVTVPAGQTLEIEPGVEVNFAGRWSFAVNGRLNARGTATDSIRFTIDTLAYPDKWKGLRFAGASDSSTMSYCRIENAHWSNEGADTYGGGVTFLDCSPLIEHSTIQHCSSDQIGGGIKLLNSSARILACRIANNSAPYGGGIECGAQTAHGSQPIIRGCVIENNAAGQGGGIGCWNNSDMTVTNCTFAGNVGDDAGGIRLCCGATATISSSIFAGNDMAAIVLLSEATAQISYSCFRNNAVIGGVPAGFGHLSTVNANADSCDAYFNIFLNPRFENGPAGNYHLMAESPCINAGEPALPPDPDGSITDMGAFYRPMHAGGSAFVTLISAGPPRWAYRLTCTSGMVSRIIFTDFCTGTIGSVSGAAAENWHVMTNGDGNNGDSIVFYSPVPMTVGQLDTFRLSHPSCVEQIRWCVNDTCGQVEGPLPVELLTFSATHGDGEVTLSWLTASETDVATFEVLRDGVRIWSLLSQGSSSSGAEYRRTDTGLINGQAYRYTLAEVDLSGLRTTLAELTATPGIGRPSVTDYAMYPNYPNPFNPKTTIAFDMVEAGHVDLAVFNLMGQKVSELVNGRMAAGHHQLSFDATGLPSGLYVYRLNVNGYVSEKKMLLMK
jgi:regulation of enolase protein 1 (concanavalin A-like superfamily)